MQRSLSPTEVSEALERTLARPELSPGENPLEKLIEALIEWLDGVFDWNLAPGSSEGLARVVLWVVLGILTLVLVLLVVRLIREARRRTRREFGAASAQAVRRRVAELRELARAAEAEGAWLEALRLYFFALVVGLGQRGDLEYRDAWTNRELLVRGEPSPAVAQTLAPLVLELDARSFGTLEADREDARRFAAACERLLGEEA